MDNEQAAHDDELDPDLADPDEAPAPPPVDGGSIFGQLHAKNDALAAARFLVKDVPGYDGLLQIRYRPVDWTPIEKIQERAQQSQSPVATRNAACDILIRAIDEVLVKDTEGEIGEPGEMQPLSQTKQFEDKAPVKFDKRLGQACGFDVRSARECVVKLFRADVPGTGNDVKLIAHQAEVANWIQASDVEIDQGF